jgi:hypothetical protein
MTNVIQSQSQRNSTFIFPPDAQSDITWLMENGPDGGSDERTLKTGPYNYLMTFPKIITGCYLYTGAT